MLGEWNHSGENRLQEGQEKKKRKQPVTLEDSGGRVKEEPWEWTRHNKGDEWKVEAIGAQL